jgi:hypothetical protein
MSRRLLDTPRRDPDLRLCDHPTCDRLGEHRAPRSRGELKSYYWFCLDHVREYNAAWDYFDGMSQDEIEQFQRKNAYWHRPTWRLGMRPGGEWSEDGLHDGLGLFGNGERPGPINGDDGAAAWRFKPGERHALAQMNLGSPVTLKEIKERYKELVKQHHPDANGGDKQAEERLKKIIQAYTHLLSCGYT